VGCLVLALVAGAGTPALAAQAQAQPQGATVGATPQLGPGPSGSFHAVAPQRLLDTRTTSLPLASGVVRPLDVGALAHLSAPSVAAVLVHVTVVGASHEGYLTLFPDGALPPATSTLNYAAGRTMANSAVVQLSAAGVLDIRVSRGPVEVIIDYSGWYAAGLAGVPGSFVPVSATRLADTRLSRTPVGPAEARTRVSGVAGVPGTAGAVVLNVTAVGADGQVPLTVWASGSARPLASSLNAARGLTVAEMVVAQVGATGEVSYASASRASTDVVIDLVGYFVGGAPVPGGYLAVAPTRVLDTRVGAVPLRGPGSRTVTVGGPARSLTPGAPPSAVVLTVTAFAPTRAGSWLTVWGHGQVRPAVSLLNPQPDTPVAQVAVVPIGIDGSVDVYGSAGSTGLVVDVVGYVVGTPLPPVVPAVALASTTPVGTPSGVQARAILSNANRYALTTWWPTVAPTLLAQTTGATGMRDTEDSPRRLSMEAFSLAVALSTGGYDAQATGVPADQATAVVTQLVDAVVAGHRANVDGGWGGTWQSPLLASLVGRAGWLVWADLTPQTRTRVERMVISEADFVDGLAPRYMTDLAGTVLTPGDTAAEEDSWYALAPALATAMVPAARQWSTWREQEEQMLVAAWARPADTTSTVSVDGRPLSDWLAGSNVEPDGTVVNHNRIAPDYSTTLYQSVDAAELALLAGQSAPQSTLHGLGPVYAAFSGDSFLAPPNLAPGGTVYDPGTAAIYYPQGCDWGVAQQIPYALADADADAFGFLDGNEAATDNDRHAAAALAMQDRTGTGAMYVSSAEYTYVGREEHAAQLAGQLYLTEYLRSRVPLAVAASSQSVVVGVPQVPAPAPQSEARYQAATP
jgi:hypothetical protein